jgi:hypothetical protein
MGTEKEAAANSKAILTFPHFSYAAASAFWK